MALKTGLISRPACRHLTRLSLGHKYLVPLNLISETAIGEINDTDLARSWSEGQAWYCM
jgi:hypothetical protein